MTTALIDPQTQGQIVAAKLCDLGVSCELVGVQEAPQITRIEIRPIGKTRMMDFSRLQRASDLAYALEAQSVSITAPVPGRNVVGVEVARKDRQVVTLDDLPPAHFPLSCPLGIQVDGRPALLHIPDAPHTLVAGTTGSGKTTCLHSILAALLSTHSPADLRLCLIDPKRVEMVAWEDAPHLAAPVAESAQEAIRQLRALVSNMDDRYNLLRRIGARNIAEANEKLPGLDSEKMPYLLVVCDELAELMMTSAKEVESLIVRLAQKGRACGVHLILATQYPKAEVVTGLLRVNLPTKIAFAVPDKTASRVILDQNGAEDLLGHGDGLLSFGGLPPVRFQSAMTTPEEIQSIIARSRGKETT